MNNNKYNKVEDKYKDAYLEWSRSFKTENYMNINHPGILGEHKNKRLLKLWNKLPLKEKECWRTCKLTSDWIQPNTVKYCARHHKWEDGLVRVAKSKEDDIWYIIDECYGKINTIEGDWPKDKDGDYYEQSKVALQVRWTEMGLKLHFKAKL